MRNMKQRIVALFAVVVFAATASVAASAQSHGQQGLSAQQIAKKVRHELVMLPDYGVFDNLAYRIQGSTVTLYGQVVKPSTRKDAERRISRIPGVAQVVNNIEVLPLSGFDDTIRASTYQAIFRSGSLYRYAMGTNPSIHIIVKNGHVTLEGVVATKMDRNLANIAASGVPGVFSVTNNLKTDREARGAY